MALQRQYIISLEDEAGDPTDNRLEVFRHDDGTVGLTCVGRFDRDEANEERIKLWLTEENLGELYAVLGAVRDGRDSDIPEAVSLRSVPHT